MKRLLILLLAFITVANGSELPESVFFKQGAVNTCVIRSGESKLAINSAGDHSVDLLLLTHGRRDIVDAARSVIGAELLAGKSTVDYVEEGEEFWSNWWLNRFDYYNQQVTQRPLSPLSELGEFPEEALEWNGLSVQAISTPGYTVDGTTYLVEIDDRKIAFCGDLILAGGKVRDLFSFQNEVADAKIGGYHGYAGRLSTWLSSLERLAAEKPDLLIPARGPVSFDPVGDIRRATERARAIYRNYLETNALHWYFGEERMGKCAELVLGSDYGVKGMQFAEHVDLPDWCKHISTTKLLVSETKRGFVLDVGGPTQLKALKQLVSEGLLSGIDGIFATHCHNDHTAAIAEAAKEFQCPVYALPEVADVLTHPGKWFLPGVSANAVAPIQVKKDGETMDWEEFSLTFRFYPGQMYNHGALLVEKAGHDPVFFIGDSFSPSGLDDYCLMNRNLMREDSGYELCFQIIEKMPETTWLVNQHIPHLFRFSVEELHFLKSKYKARKQLIADFVAIDDPNYAIDPQWAYAYPYGQTAKPGEEIQLEFRIWNHSTVDRSFTIRPKSDLAIEWAPASLQIPARSHDSISISAVMPADAAPGIHIITADILRNDGFEALSFCEAIIRIE